MKRLRRPPLAQAQHSAALDDAGFEQLACAMRRNMFLSGLCFGGSLTALFMLHAYGALSLAIAIEVVWIAWRGWPWEV